MNGLIVNSLHFAAAAAGALTIYGLARQPRLRVLFWPAAFALSALIGAYALLVSEPHAWFEDFETAYWPAGVAVWSGGGALRAVLERGVDGFVNLPVVAYLFAPFGLLPEKPAAVLYFGLGGVALLATWLLLTRLYALSRRDSALALFGLAAFGPVAYSLREANSSHLLLPVLLMGLLAIRKGREGLGGGLFGLAAVMKPPLLVLGVLYALRGRWRVVAGGAGVCAAFALSSLAIFGWEVHRSWYEATIAPYASHPIAAFNAQSLASFAARAEAGLPGYVNWDAFAISTTAKALVYAATGLVLALCIVAARKRPTQEQMEIEAYMAIAFVCVASTLAWSHYFVWLAPAFVVLLTHPAGAGAMRAVVVGALVLALPAEFMSPQMRTGEYGVFSNLLTSHLTIAALAVLAALALLRFRSGKERFSLNGRTARPAPHSLSA